MRVLSRLTNDTTDVLSTAGKKHFTKLASDLISQDDPGAFNQALMELGENICLPNTLPHCSLCPLQNDCEAVRFGTAGDLPVRIKKTQRRVENRHVVLLISDEEAPKILLHRRDDRGLLGGMWEFPNTTDEQPLCGIPGALVSESSLVDILPASKHLFSHIEWRMQGHHYRIKESCDTADDYCWVTLSELEESYPIPGAFAAYKKLLKQLMCKER